MTSNNPEVQIYHPRVHLKKSVIEGNLLNYPTLSIFGEFFFYDVAKKMTFKANDIDTKKIFENVYCLNRS